MAIGGKRAQAAPPAWRHLRVVLLACCCLLLGAGGARSAESLVVDATEYPWSAIGRINTEGRGFCTGFLVGPRTVLTVAHCLYNLRDGRWYQPEDVHFVAGYQRDHYLAHARAAAFVTAPGFHPREAPGLKRSLQDWAVVTLTEPIGRAVGWLGLQRFDAKLLATLRRGGALLLQAGYRRERSHAISVGLGCDIAALLAERRVLLHDCDVNEGASGSPLLILSGGGLRVLGLHTLRTVDDQGVAYGAVLAASAFDPAQGEPHAIAAGRAAGLSWDQGAGPAAGGQAREEPSDTVAQLLARLGFLGKGQDTAHAPGARQAAIKAFQKSTGLPVTGEPSIALLARLAAALR